MSQNDPNMQPAPQDPSNEDTVVQETYSETVVQPVAATDPYAAPSTGTSNAGSQGSAAPAVPAAPTAPAAPEGKTYTYPRKMLIAAFVLGIVGTALGAIALIVALAGAVDDFDGHGGRGDMGGYSRMEDYGDWDEDWEDGWEQGWEDGRGGSETGPDSRHDRDRDRSCSNTADDSQSA